MGFERYAAYPPNWVADLILRGRFGRRRNAG
ncbi:hypothetical protein [Thermus phage P23-45]|uniref:Uncharacterized protein n=1 Tax=Thermus virus P23-45 TaxID=2914006 RepID=A7XX74_BP234|nr:hypothetical protein P23p47 [Thermus phage P23-45]ABU96880.1 hypothetical protein P23p47 [Thermus phage P23-45]API81853.1 hypothetical protein G20c_45 [Thermus phage G20c]UYB98427.1 hypothetical protein [Thermus phage P23-45]